MRVSEAQPYRRSGCSLKQAIGSQLDETKTDKNIMTTIPPEVPPGIDNYQRAQETIEILREPISWARAMSPGSRAGSRCATHMFRRVTRMSSTKNDPVDRSPIRSRTAPKLLARLGSSWYVPPIAAAPCRETVALGCPAVESTRTDTRNSRSC